MQAADLQKIRDDFPQLDGPDYHYLDASASSLTPQPVLDAVIEYYTKYRANTHRGLYREAVRATDAYEAARKAVAKFIGAGEPSEVIFTSGATESSNMLVRMLEVSFGWDLADETTAVTKEIVTTEMEHHGALVPLQELAERTNMNLKHIPVLLPSGDAPEGERDGGPVLDYEAAERLIGPNTVLVSVMLASNVTGTINDVARIGKLAHKHGAIFVVDATAAAGHIPVDVKALDADMLYFSGHKMMAPTGIGVLWARMPLLERLKPAVFGGHMISHVDMQKARWAPIPERFEPGTKNIAGVIGLGSAVGYLSVIGLENIHRHAGMLAFMAVQKLEQIEGVRVFSPCDPKQNFGVVSFAAEWAHPHDIADILGRDRVAVRAGHHCAEPLHGVLGVPATVRASFHIYNTKEDVEALVEGVKKAREIFTGK